MSTTKLLYNKAWYLPTSLVDKDGHVTLIIHRYQIRQGQKIYFTNKTDALEFDNSEQMAETITRKRLRRLPSEADGNPRYVPKRVQTLLNKHKANL